jgi:hypothetical protein
MIAALCALALLQTPVDQGTLVIRQDSLDVAHEGFRLSTGRLSAGNSGWSLAATVRYDRVRPVLSLAPILEVAADSSPLTLQYDVADPREALRILGQVGRGRFTVRTITRSMERAREFPATGATVVLDDSVYAFYLFAAWRATTPPAPPAAINAIFPRALRRETLAVQDVGPEPVTVNHQAVTLRHVTVTGGANGVVHLWLDAAGHLQRIEIPSRHVVVERQPSS